MSFADMNDTSESWSSYRMLVVKSLAQLDERTRDIHTNQTKMISRFDEFEKGLESTKKNVEVITAKVAAIETKDSILQGKQSVWDQISKSTWGIIMVIVTVIINIAFTQWVH